MRYIIFSIFLITIAHSHSDDIFGTFSISKKEFIGCLKNPISRDCVQKISSGCDMFCDDPSDEDIKKTCRSLCKSKKKTKNLSYSLNEKSDNSKKKT